MDDVVIKVEHLKKVYKLYDKKSDRLKEAIHPGKKKYSKDFYALKDISFDVKRGETIGIIGTNGSGKSTLLKILTGVVAPSGGSYEVNGKVSALLELGAGFNMEYTGLQNIDLQGVMMGYTEEEMKTRRDDIIKFADIGDYIKQPVKNYSSGMFARLAFAVAISIDPEILIVDEALSVGDVFFQSKCFRKFDELKEKGVSILFVSHDTNAVREMCSRVLWIEHGEQQMFDTCNDVCTAYFNAQMARMNSEAEKSLSGLKTEEGQLADDIGDEALICPHLEPKSNSVLSPKAEIVSTFLRNEANEFTVEMKAGHRYTLTIVSQFHEDLEQVIIGFSLINSKGVIWLAGNTYAQTKTNFTVKKGDILETSFSFVAPMLRSGTYEISPAIALGVQDNHVNLTWLHGAVAVELYNSAYEISELGLPYEIQNKRIKSFMLVE